MRRNWCLVSMMAISLMGATTVLTAWGQNTEVKGTIMNRDGDTLLIKTADGNTTVLLTDSTYTKDDTGFFGLDKEMGNVVLIPGLKVRVEGTAGGGGQVTANRITVDGDDLETAEMIQSGLHPTAQQVAENVRRLEEHNAKITGHSSDIADIQAKLGMSQSQLDAVIKDTEENSARFIALSDYDSRGAATVKFKVGSSKLDAEDEAQLKTLADTAVGLKGYIIEVTGYADATGSAEMNTKLSEDRAKAVIHFLMQQGNVPVRHIVAPGAMGEYGAAATNETKEGRAENRRVEVKILVNKGMNPTS
jgi:OmpA-OmpF porin, OOP family